MLDDNETTYLEAQPEINPSMYLDIKVLKCFGFVVYNSDPSI